MSTDPCAVAVVGDEQVVDFVRSAEKWLIVVAPAVTETIALALTERARVLAPREVTVILDTDPEVFRLGYGDPRSLELLEAASSSLLRVRRQPGLRLCIVIADHPTDRMVGESTGCVTDDELVALARQGSADAYDELVVRHQAAAYRAALAALRNCQDAEEAAQDALVRAWSSLGRYRGDSSFRTWLLAIAWNSALARRRSVLRWLRRKAPLDEAALMTGDVGEAPDQSASDGELRRHVASAIDALTPKLRDALLLAQSGEYGYGEIARMLRVPVGTVKWRVFEARRRVKERLQALGYVHGS